MPGARRCLATLVAWVALSAAAAESLPPHVTKVEIVPAGLVSRVELRELLELETPGPLDQAALDRTILNLLETGRFLAAKARLTTVRPGVRVLRIHVTPRPFARKVRFEGATQIPVDRLRRGIDVRRYTPADSDLVLKSEKQLADLYVRNGFPRPETRSEVVSLGSDGAVEVLFTLHEYPLPPATSVNTRIDGRLNLWSRFLLWSKLSFRQRTTKRVGVNDEQWQRFLDQEQRRLRLQGFREADLSHQVTETDDGLTLEAFIDLGRKTRIRTPGVPRSVRADVIEMWRRRPAPLTDTRIDRLHRAAVQGLREKGWLEASAEHRVVETETTKTLVISAVRGRRSWVKEVRFIGNDAIPDDELLSVLGLRPPRFFGLLKSRPGPRALEDNVDALKSFYASRGYPQSRVETRLDESPDGGHTVEFAIRKGQHRHIASVQIHGASAFEHAVLEKTAGLTPGDPYWVNRVRDAATSLVRLYRAAGFTDATVRPRAETHADGSVDVRFDITEGPAYRRGPTIVRNSFKTRPRVTYQLQTVEPDAPFDMVPVAELQQKLNRLRVFDTVRLETKDRADLEVPHKAVVVEVRERPTGFVELGFDLNTQRGLELIAEIGDRNVAGRAISLSAQALYGSERRRVAVDASRHVLFGMPLFHFARASYFDDRTYIGFNLATTKVGAGIEKELRRSLSLSLVYILEKQSPYDVEPDVDLDIAYEEGRIGSLTPSVIYDTRDDPFRPTRGLLALTRNKASRPALGAQSSYDRWEVDLRWFTEITNGVVLATAARAGRAWIHGDSELPLGDRFYLGGATTHRGFKERELGPHGEDGSVLGGESFALANAELRFPIRGILDGGVFVDVGNVYLGNVDLDDVRTCVGLGLRLDTPVGPLRVDVGYNLGRRPDEPSSVLHVALGHAF